MGETNKRLQSDSSTVEERLLSIRDQLSYLVDEGNAQRVDAIWEDVDGLDRNLAGMTA